MTLEGADLAFAEYVRSPSVLTFVVDGIAAPQGSKSSRVTPSGKVNMFEASKRLKPWRAEVQKAIEAAMTVRTPAGGWPLLGPIGIDLVFTMPKPKAAPKTRLTWPIGKPDADKLARAVLDAGTYAGLWNDDSQVVDLHPFKVYPVETPRALAQPGLLGVVYLIGPAPTVAAPQPSLLGP